MKAVTGELPDNEDGWAWEIKWDGMRIMAYVGDDRWPLRLETTRGSDATARFPELAGLVAALGPHTAILDGEVVAFDGDRPSFGRLQGRMHLANPTLITQRAAEIPVVYVAFDIVHLDGEDLTQVPYLGRRARLVGLLEDEPAWRVPEHFLDDGAGLLEVARQQRLEGIMAKRHDSIYLAGTRSPAWRKIKVKGRQELVVGGWQPGTGNRTGQLGSLLVGYYHDGELRYAGRVGTGYNAAALHHLGQLLADLTTDQSPFNPPPPPPVARNSTWVRPQLVAEIQYNEWPPGGLLRHPSYLGLRHDKDPHDVVREA